MPHTQVESGKINMGYFTHSKIIMDCSTQSEERRDNGCSHKVERGVINRGSSTQRSDNRLLIRTQWSFYRLLLHK